MQIYKRVRLTKQELEKLQRECDGYIWAAVDSRKYAISLGDDYLADLRDALLIRRCGLENIYGIGLDLRTGKIDFVAQINRRNPTVDASGKLSAESRDDVVRALHYFFERLPAYRNNRDSLTNDDDDYDDATIAFR